MRNIIAVVALTLAPSIAGAGEFYGLFGGGVANAGFGTSFSNRIGGGWTWDSGVSLEAAYLHFAKDTEIERTSTVVGNISTRNTHQTSGESSGVALSATYGWPLGQFKPYVRLGTLLDLSSFSDTREQVIFDTITMTVIDRSLTSTGESRHGRVRLMSGVGVSFNIVSLEYIRAESAGQDRHADALHLLIRMPLP